MLPKRSLNCCEGCPTHWKHLPRSWIIKARAIKVLQFHHLNSVVALLEKLQAACGQPLQNWTAAQVQCGITATNLEPFSHLWQYGEGSPACVIFCCYAGRKAMARVQRRMRKVKRDAGQQSSLSEKRSLGNITCRTKYLDDLVMLFTNSYHNLPGYFEALAQAVASACKTAPVKVKQIVLVGAGMDTRSLRLDVAADVQWFELDRGSVLQVKQSLLRKTLQNHNQSCRVTQASCAS
jgi:hypothetical protein